jgi:SAM-dependent methyltransferase
MPDSASTFQPRRFRSTVPYYARYRLPYPEELIARVVARVGLESGDSVLDLGCGPGLLAVPFARAGMRVTAVDPEPDMLAAAGEAAGAAGVALDIRQGSSFALPTGIGPFKLVTMGRAFHWMDREATLKTLDGLVVPNGAIAFFEDHHPKTVENAWHRAMRKIADDYGREDTPHVQTSARPDHRGRESILFDSAFSHIESIGVFIRRSLTTEDIVGLTLSLSVSSTELLGERRAAFEAELRAKLAELSPNGHFTEIAEMAAQIAMRPR